jgi:hypothetical protein
VLGVVDQQECALARKRLADAFSERAAGHLTDAQRLGDDG